MNELDPLIAAQYPKLYPQDAFEPESQSGSPMSQAGGVTEGESFSVSDGTNFRRRDVKSHIIIILLQCEKYEDYAND